MAQTTGKNNESGDNDADISNSDDSAQPSTSIGPVSGEGTIIGDTNSPNVNKESSHGESNQTKIATETDNLNESECIEKDKDVLEDSNELELKWDEDDKNNTTLDDETHNIDDDLEKKLLEETEQDSQDVSNELEKETEPSLEDKLLQEPINSVSTSENIEQNSTEVPMEVIDDEVLRETHSEDTEAMNIDGNEDSITKNESIKSVIDVGKITPGRRVDTDVRVTQTSKSKDDPNSSDNDAVEATLLRPKAAYGFNKPDVMLEIPTQEIDINDFPDSPIDGENNVNMDETHNTTEEITASSVDNPEPSTSTEFPKMTSDISGEEQEATDCLGLLAVTTRVVDEDEDQDDDDGDADDDQDDDDSGQDESSNQSTANHSEDFNAPHSDTEPAGDDDDLEQGDEEFVSDEVDIDDNCVDGQLERKLKEELEDNEDEVRTLTHPIFRTRKENDQTSELQHSVKKEKEDNIVLTCGTKEKDSTYISQDNIKKDKEGDLISTCQDNENEPHEKEDSILSKDKGSSIISQNDVAKENKYNVNTSTITKEIESTTASQDLKKEKEITIEAREKSEEEAIKSVESVVQSVHSVLEAAVQSIDAVLESAVQSVDAVLESAVQSIDPANKEKVDGLPVGITVKTENENTTKRRRSIEKEVVKKYIETEISDDVIEHVLEIETVNISDDDDDEPENLQQETDKKKPLEEIAQGTTASEKNTAAKEVIALDESTEPEKSEEPAVVSEISAADAEVEKAAESDDATVNVTLDQSNTEADGSTAFPNSSKMRNLKVSTPLNATFISVVDLEESSSSEDDIEEVSKDSPADHSVSQLQQLLDTPFKPPTLTPMTTVNIPTEIDIMTTSGIGGNKTHIVTKEGEVVISGVPKPPPQKTARLNTSEVTIKSAVSVENSLVIPEAKSQETLTPAKPKVSLEIFSLDSDEEETPAKEPLVPKKKMKKCINSACSSGSTELKAADSVTAEYYEAAIKKRNFVCQPCADAVLVRQQKLMEGIKNMTPLMKLDPKSNPQDLVEISDSESEDEDPEPQEQQQQQPKETIGEDVAKFLEENLADVLNETWKKYKLDDRLKVTQSEIDSEILKLEKESEEINQMFNECQRFTDKLRADLYATFERRKIESPSILIYDTPEFNYIGPDTENAIPAKVINESRLSVKRKLEIKNETPAKRPAIPLGYAPLENSKQKEQECKSDDDKDISVVKLSAESAPPDLPPPGELSRPPLRLGMAVYAMKNAFGPWFKGKVMEVTPKSGTAIPFTMCRIKFDHKQKNSGKVLPARCIAYAEPAEVRMTIGTRLIALFKDTTKRESYYSGVVAEIPNPVNNYRYLVFFDDGYAQYVSHAHTRLVCECSNLVWEEVHPLSREFVREYLMAYPERPMVKLREGQQLKTEWDGKWWTSRVTRVDASLAQVVFMGDGRREWIYRGSTRLAPLYIELRAAEKHRPRPMPRSTQPRSNLLPYVEYTRSIEQTDKETQPVPVALSTQQQTEEIRQQRAVAKKSTTSCLLPVPPTGLSSVKTAVGSRLNPPVLDPDNNKVVYYTPKNAVRPYKLVPHTCSPACKRTDVLSLKELRSYNPLAKPLLSGWERQVVRYRGQRGVAYRAPCGRRLRDMSELHRYLRVTLSDLPVDLFDFNHLTHCLAEFIQQRSLVAKKDLSHGKENMPVPCVNAVDETLPEFCLYNTERTPTSGVPLNLDPDFLCGCDCTDDCEDKTKCACWQLTLEGARTIGLDGVNVGYEYKRLIEPLPSGIYECNSRCKCKQTCLNRVAQHPLQLKLQVFKTLNRGWGIRALNDVPKGSFLCVYAGNLLTDATANLDGLNEGDEYLAELDYIEVVEQMKEGYEEDIPEADKKLDKKESTKAESSEEEISSSSEEDENASKTDKEDDDFRPGYVSLGLTDFSKSLRKRSKKETGRNTKKEKEKEKENKEDPEDDCITISDDDEVREPSRFTANPGMAGSDFISKYRSVRTLFGEDEACYIMDAKVQGNIGRYLNHSCSPNVFVQNVFVDTHDPRFPWVAFFALSHVKAGTELTWNYNYDVGSVPGKILYCYCEAPNCRGRLL